MSSIEIFPKAIGKYTLESSKHLQLKNFCVDLLSSKIQKEDTRINSEDSKLSHYFNEANKNLLQFEELTWFEEWITQKCVEYIKNTLGYYLKDGVIVTDCWLNNCDKGGGQFYHTHSNCYVSGTYYVNFIKGLHAPLSFRNRDFNPENCSLQFFEIPIVDNTKYNTGGAVIDHGEADLILWQSNLPHGYFDNNQDNRVSISFNVMPKYLHNKSYSFRIEKDDIN